MTDNNENNQEIVNDVVEETKEAVEENIENQEGYTAEEPAQVDQKTDTQSFAEKIELDEKVEATKNFFSKFWNFVKVCFTQSFPSGVKVASTEKTPYWIIIMVANALFMGLGVLIMIMRIMGPLRSFIPGGYVFLIGLLGSLLFFWAAVGGTTGLLAICKKKFSFQSLCNVVAVAWIPLTLICVVNMLIGLVYPPLAILLASVAQIMFYILLYMGIQTLAKFQKSPFLWFSLMILVVLIVFAVIFSIIVKGMANGMATSAMGGLGSLLYR